MKKIRAFFEAAGSAWASVGFAAFAFGVLLFFTYQYMEKARVSSNAFTTDRIVALTTEVIEYKHTLAYQQNEIIRLEDEHKDLVEFYTRREVLTANQLLELENEVFQLSESELCVNGVFIRFDSDDTSTSFPINVCGKGLHLEFIEFGDSSSDNGPTP